MLNTNEKIIKHKVGLLNLAEELGNVSKACKIMGLSRDTFYRYQNAVEEGGIEALFERTRRKPNTKNRVDEQTEAAVWWPMPWSSRPMVRRGPAMSSANRVCLSPVVVYAVSGMLLTFIYPQILRKSHFQNKWNYHLI